MGNLILAVFDCDCQFLRQIHSFFLRPNKLYPKARGLKNYIQMEYEDSVSEID